MSCNQIRDLLALYLYGELSGAEEEQVESHCAACAACAAALERERVLHKTLDRSSLEPPPILLPACRRDLRAAIERSASVRAASGWRQHLSDLFPSMSWRPAAAAMALLAAGFFGGRISLPARGGPAVPATAAPEVVATRVRNLDTDAQGGVRIVLEETRQRTVAGSLQEEPIRRLLLAAAQNEADPGMRVESVELLRRESAAAEVRRALMTALERDTNPGVRLRALEALKPYSSDPEVRRAVAQAVLRDSHVGLRTQAVDLLVEQPQRDVVDVLQRLMEREDNNYIRSRTRKALEELNASVETF